MESANPSDPVLRFSSWFKKAKASRAIEDATAMCLSTAGVDGYPDGRMVLLKDFDARGFVFYTNLHSPKGRAIAQTPRVALTFHWEPLKMQVRIQGDTELVSDAEADAYWKTRPRLSRLGAWASKQSEPLASRGILIKEVAKLALKYKMGPVPRPAWWTGIRVLPRRIEFWQGRPNRLHDRFLYTKTSSGWTMARLYP